MARKNTQSDRSGTEITYRATNYDSERSGRKRSGGSSRENEIKIGILIDGKSSREIWSHTNSNKFS